MGRIVGGLGSPHAPSIGALIDKSAWDDPDWKPLMDGYRPMQAWLAKTKGARQAALTSMPSSSSSSRIRQASGLSPGSTLPPGNSQKPS